MSFDVVLFDDARARNWMPFALTRPVGELLFGAHTFRARAVLRFGSCTGHITAPALAGFSEPGAAPVLASAEWAGGTARLFLSSRAVVEPGAAFEPAGPGLVSVSGRIAGCFLPAGSAPPAEFFARPAGYRIEPSGRGTTAFFEVQQEQTHAAAYDLPGQLLENVWDLVVGNAAQISHDFEAASGVATSGLPGSGSEAAGATTQRGPAEMGAGVHLTGGKSDRLRFAEDVTIEPGVLLDVAAGPVWFGRGVTVRAFSRIAGPTFVDERSTLLGGSFSAVTIGPACKVHGEMEESVVLGYSNKAHDGFLGHAYLGRWVNLGALTTNSDLKNNYGTIRVWTPDGDVDSGQVKIGCLLGDHVKTGIGVMLNTGTVIGAGSNVFGALQPPKYVPPFRWGSGQALGEYDLGKFLQVAEVVMARREIRLHDAERDLLTRAWHAHRQPSQEKP